MVRFGETLSASKRPDWYKYYLDYDRLKTILKKSIKSHQGIAKRASHSHLLDSVDMGMTHHHIPESLLLELEFRHAVDQEIEKVVLFLLELQGNVARELSALSTRREDCVALAATLLNDFQRGEGGFSTASSSSSSPESAFFMLRETHEGYMNVANMILHFVSYVELNITALRKILKKHDKFHPEHKIAQSYLTNFTKEVDSHMDQLFNDEGLSALLATLNNAFMELHQVELKLNMIQDASRVRRAKSAPSFLAAGGWEHDDTYLSKTIVSSKRRSMLSMKETLLIEYSKNTPLELDDDSSESDTPTRITSLHEPILDEIYSERSQLKKSTIYVELVAAQSLMFDPGFDEDITSSLREKEAKSRRAWLSSFLNLTSTFLYMANYNIVAPTTGQYAARLGSSEALAGIIIGMTPNAALLATILYCWWSNFSYKNAMVFAATCCLCGNICYALALQYESITLVMVGRFLNGFGSARSINRRFIADTYARAERTAASAAFVTAGTLGMATGPAIAAILGHLQFDPTNLLWAEETAPGWVMMVLWTIFVILSVLFFEEPDRSHLYSNVPKAVVQPDEHYSNKNGEAKPLLTNGEMTTTTTKSEQKPKPLYHNIPVMVTLWIYFVLKLVSECTGSSCATLTSYYFGWDARHSGAFLAFLGLLLFPVNIIVAALSRRYEDRELIFATLLVMLVSLAGIISYWPEHYTVYQYMFFGVCVYVSSSILEAPNMSLLSKTIPKEWARGTFNSGFMATEAGTAARSVGDILFSLAAAFGGADSLLNATFLSLLGFVFVSILLTRKMFDALIEDDEDDDSSVVRSEKK